MFKIYIYNEPFVLKTGQRDIDSIEKIIDQEAKEKNKEQSIHRSVRRTKSVISDLVICNEFDLFVTFTFSPNKVDRYDVNACKRVMHNWLMRNKMRDRSPNLKYLIVPEFHKKCEECVTARIDLCVHFNRPKALHFHALIKNYNGKLKDSGKLQKGRKVYNLTGFRSGHTTACKIDNHEAVGNYVKKYITKDMPLLYAKKRYWASRGLVRPHKHVNFFESLRTRTIQNIKMVHTKASRRKYFPDQPVVKFENNEQLFNFHNDTFNGYAKKTYRSEYYQVYEMPKL